MEVFYRFDQWHYRWLGAGWQAAAMTDRHTGRMYSVLPDATNAEIAERIANAAILSAGGPITPEERRYALDLAKRLGRA